MKTYIDFNTEKRRNSANSFEKKIRLMISSVYDKTMENLRKRINVRLVNNAKDYKEFVSKPSFVQVLFHKNIFKKILLLFIKLKQF